MLRQVDVMIFSNFSIMFKFDSTKPIIVVNFKDYEEATGKGAEALAVVHERVLKETGAQLVVAVHPTDLRGVVEAAPGLPVISQNGDSYTRGSDDEMKKTQTGRMTPKMIERCGGVGTLINHAENPRTDDEIYEIVTDFELENPALLTIVCAENSERGEAIKALCKPDFVAIEPPDLIGGDVSVTTRPEIVSDAVSRLGDNVLVGAGVKTGEDIRSALELGAKGVLLASGVVKPKGDMTPEEVLNELVKA